MDAQTSRPPCHLADHISDVSACSSIASSGSPPSYDPRCRWNSRCFPLQHGHVKFPSSIYSSPVNHTVRTQSRRHTIITSSETSEDIVGRGLRNQSFRCVILHLTLQLFSLHLLSPSCRRSLLQQSNSLNRKSHRATSKITTNDERPQPRVP